jgi:NAD(P)-dependent dehydrogenase (short-subunit alcohol dehydrogenase family)
VKLPGADVIVTGGASGLGAATCRALAQAGAIVTLLDRNVALGRAIAEEVGGSFAEVDVADGPSVEAAFAEVLNLRALVCCAGVGGGRSMLRRAKEQPSGEPATYVPHDLESFERVVRVNLIGTFNCVRLAAWKMQTLNPDSKGERGVIITTSSIAAFDGVDGGTAYSASKGGVASMTLPLARDLGRHGVRVVSIAPGPFDTPLVEGMPPSYNNKLVEESPFPHRMGKPEEYASLALHLIDNPMMNGEVIRIDAGMRMSPSSFR